MTNVEKKKVRFIRRSIGISISLLFLALFGIAVKYAVKYKMTWENTWENTLSEAEEKLAIATRRGEFEHIQLAVNHVFDRQKSKIRLDDLIDKDGAIVVIVEPSSCSVCYEETLSFWNDVKVDAAGIEVKPVFVVIDSPESSMSELQLFRKTYLSNNEIYTLPLASTPDRIKLLTKHTDTKILILFVVNYSFVVEAFSPNYKFDKQDHEAFLEMVAMYFQSHKTDGLAVNSLIHDNDSVGTSEETSRETDSCACPNEEQSQAMLLPLHK